MQTTLQKLVCAPNFSCCEKARSSWCQPGSAFALLMAFLLTSHQAVAADIRVSVKDQAGRPVEGAIVWVQQSGEKNPPAPVQLEIIQKNRQFLPPLTVVPVGSAVRFPNQDNVQHHVYSFSLPKTFDIPLYIGQSPPIQFDRPGIVALGCNIHDWMAAYIVVLDTRLYAQTDASGLAVLTNVPADPVTIHAWCPRLRGDPLTYRTPSGQSSAELTMKLRPAFTRTPPDDRGGGYR
jgi:plastocyanin